MAEKHCSLCKDCIHSGTCYRESNKRAYKGDLDISGCKYYKSAADVVSRSAYDQIRWERDIDMQQLYEAGIPFGGKSDKEYAPVVHAEWIDRDGKTWCSRCDASNKQYKPPYCPHCGAHMDGE